MDDEREAGPGTGPATNVAQTNWWWVVVPKESSSRVAGFEHEDVARGFADRYYPSRARLEQGTPDHLPSAHDRREEAHYARRRAEFEALSPEDRAKEFERIKKHLDSVQTLPVGATIWGARVGGVEEIEEALGDQALMAVEDELQIILEPPPVESRIHYSTEWSRITLCGIPLDKGAGTVVSAEAILAGRARAGSASCPACIEAIPDIPKKL